MGILDGIVEWIAKQVMNGLDLISTSVLGALGCDMGTFLRYFPAAETMYKVFVATAIGLVLLNWVWQLFKNFGLIAGVEAEDPFKLSIRSVLFIGLIYYCDQITDMVLSIGGTPYSWILSSDLPPLNFADFNSVLLTILDVCASGSVTLIALILLLILAWNYIKLLFEAAERYVLLGVVVYTAPMAFATGASQSTSNIDETWQLIGAASNRLAAEFVLEIFKIIRGYGGSAICATQDLNDFFALEDGKYGKGIINNSKTKIVLNLEDEEAMRVQSILHLSEAETMAVTHFERGNGLISTNNNNVTVEFKASELEKELITTDRNELKKLLEKERQRRQMGEAV